MALSVSRALAPLSLAMASGGGRRRASGDWSALMLDMVEAMLEEDKFRLCPRLWPPVLPRVLARERLPGGLTRSVRI